MATINKPFCLSREDSYNNFKSKMMYEFNGSEWSEAELRDIIYKILIKYDVVKKNDIKRLDYRYEDNMTITTRKIFDAIYEDEIKIKNVYNDLYIDIDIRLRIGKNDVRFYNLVLTDFIRKSKYTHYMNMSFKLYYLQGEKEEIRKIKNSLGIRNLDANN